MRGDEQSRIELAKILIEDCPLCTVLKESKPCPYFGHSGSCASCTFHWQITVSSLLEAANVKRVNYAHLKSKLDEVLERNMEMENDRTTILDLVGDIAKGARAIVSLRDMAKEAFLRAYRGLGKDVTDSDRTESEDNGNGESDLHNVRSIHGDPEGASD